MIRYAPYLMAHFGKSQLWHASVLLFAFFLTERCGLRPVDAGWIIGITLIANGIADVVLAYRCRRSLSDPQVALRMQARFAPLGAAFYVLFCMTVLLPPSLRIGWALATILAFRLSYPFIDVPQNALVALMADGPEDQRRLLAGRNIVSHLANIAVSAIAAPLLFGWTDASYIVWAALVGALCWVTAHRLPRSAGFAPVAPPRAPAIPRRTGFSLLAILLVTMVAAGALFRGMAPYFAAFAVPGAGFLLWAATGAFIAQPLWLIVAAGIGQRAGMWIVALLLLLASVLIVTPLRFSPLAPEAIAAIYGLGTGALWLALWSAMVAGARRHGTIWHVGGFTCLSKLAQGAVAMLVGGFLQTSSYHATLSDPTSRESLAMALSLAIVAGCCVILTYHGGSRREIRTRPATVT